MNLVNLAALHQHAQDAARRVYGEHAAIFLESIRPGYWNVVVNDPKALSSPHSQKDATDLESALLRMVAILDGEVRP